MAFFYCKSIQVIICSSSNNFIPPCSPPMPLLSSSLFVLPVQSLESTHLCPAIQPDLPATPGTAA